MSDIGDQRHLGVRARALCMPDGLCLRAQLGCSARLTAKISLGVSDMTMESRGTLLSCAASKM